MYWITIDGQVLYGSSHINEYIFIKYMYMYYRCINDQVL